jgi:hypothetical protein
MPGQERWESRRVLHRRIREPGRKLGRRKYFHHSHGAAMTVLTEMPHAHRSLGRGRALQMRTAQIQQLGTLAALRISESCFEQQHAIPEG